MKLIGNLNQIDEQATHVYGIPSLTLMAHAGERVSHAVYRYLKKAKLRYPKVVILSGKGNNGGDGFACAQFLASLCPEAQIKLVSFVEPDAMGADSRHFWDKLTDGIKSFISIEACHTIVETIYTADVIVDALFGSGLSRSLDPKWLALIGLINAAPGYKIAVDIPSGVFGESGVLAGDAVRANETVTFACAKPGLYVYPGKDYAGVVTIADIGIPDELINQDSSLISLITDDVVSARLPRRGPQTHKYHYGHVVVVAGSNAMPGAACMVAEAALRAGAGLVTLAAPQCVLDTTPLLPEIMRYPLPACDKGSVCLEALAVLEPKLAKANVLAVGPGLTTHDETAAFLNALLLKRNHFPTMKWVLDADALTILSQGERPFLLPQNIILTPHLGEASRLLQQETNWVQNNLLEGAKTLSQQTQTTAILKSASSIIATPQGALWINPTGNPGMATAGTGDILTGLVAGFWAQGLDAESAAMVATYLHGAAGDKAAQKLTPYCLIATDILRFLPKAIQAILKRQAD